MDFEMFVASLIFVGVINVAGLIMVAFMITHGIFKK